MRTDPTTLDLVSNATRLPLSFTFRKQPTNGEDTETWFSSVVPEWTKGKVGTEDSHAATYKLYIK